MSDETKAPPPKEPLPASLPAERPAHLPPELWELLQDGVKFRLAEADAAIRQAEATLFSQSPLTPLPQLLKGAWERLERRAEGKELPIPLPWPSLAEQFGG